MAKIEKRVTYFIEPGPENTEDVVEAVLNRIKEGDIKTIIVASTTGTTGRTFAEAFNGLAEVIVVGTNMNAKNKAEIIRLGGKVLDTTYRPLRAGGPMDRRRAHRICTSLHAYTHIEAPAVTIKDGKFIHEYSLETFVAKACVMNFSYKEAASDITLEDMDEHWVDGCEAIIIRTDWPKKRGIKDVFTGTTEEDLRLAPKFTMEAVNWIIAKKPKLYVDDFEGLCPNPPGERILFESGLCRIHRATNIDKIEKKVVTLIALPLKIMKTSVGMGVEATPTRVIAIEEE